MIKNYKIFNEVDDNFQFNFKKELYGMLKVICDVDNALFKIKAYKNIERERKICNIRDEL